MELNVSQLLMEPSGSAREYRIDEWRELAEGMGASRVRGKVSLLRTNKSVWVSAALRSDLDAECGRCLAAYSHPMRIQVEAEYVPTLNPLTGARTAPTEDDEDRFFIDESHTLDLAQAAREYAVMAAPMKPLCRPDCSGLCATCGADLNVSRCACAAPTDARWGPLLALRRESAPESQRPNQPQPKR